MRGRLKGVGEDKRESSTSLKAREEQSREGKDQRSPFICCVASPLKACPEKH